MSQNTSSLKRKTQVHLQNSTGGHDIKSMNLLHMSHMIIASCCKTIFTPAISISSGGNKSEKDQTKRVNVRSHELPEKLCVCNNPNYISTYWQFDEENVAAKLHRNIGNAIKTLNRFPVALCPSFKMYCFTQALAYAYSLKLEYDYHVAGFKKSPMPYLKHVLQEKGVAKYQHCFKPDWSTTKVFLEKVSPAIEAIFSIFEQQKQAPIEQWEFKGQIHGLLDFHALKETVEKSAAILWQSQDMLNSQSHPFLNSGPSNVVATDRSVFESLGNIVPKVVIERMSTSQLSEDLSAAGYQLETLSGSSVIDVFSDNEATENPSLENNIKSPPHQFDNGAYEPPTKKSRIKALFGSVSSESSLNNSPIHKIATLLYSTINEIHHSPLEANYAFPIEDISAFKISFALRDELPPFEDEYVFPFRDTEFFKTSPALPVEFAVTCYEGQPNTFGKTHTFIAESSITLSVLKCTPIGGYAFLTMSEVLEEALVSAEIDPAVQELYQPITASHSKEQTPIQTLLTRERDVSTHMIQNLIQRSLTLDRELSVLHNHNSGTFHRLIHSINLSIMDYQKYLRRFQK